jgi:hypothetical protein
VTVAGTKHYNFSLDVRCNKTHLAGGGSVVGSHHRGGLLVMWLLQLLQERELYSSCSTWDAAAASHSVLALHLEVTRRAKIGPAVGWLFEHAKMLVAGRG